MIVASDSEYEALHFVGGEGEEGSLDGKGDGKGEVLPYMMAEAEGMRGQA